MTDNAQAAWLRDNIDRAEWREHEGYPSLMELYIDDVLLAWVQPRPSYCDRGHFQAGIEFSPGNPIDVADGMPCYYMRLDVAKQEVREKMLWRVCKIRVTQRPLIAHSWGCNWYRNGKCDCQ